MGTEGCGFHMEISLQRDIILICYFVLVLLIPSLAIELVLCGMYGEEIGRSSN